jgi:hypothetical protein
MPARIKLTCPRNPRLLTSQDRRLNVQQIKNHPFFYGVNWDAIRQIEAPFVPRLRSITDTSYFPTDELEQVPEEPVGGDTTGANKDLAFLGWVLLHSRLRFCRSLGDRTLMANTSIVQIHVQAVHCLISCLLIAIGSSSSDIANDFMHVSNLTVGMYTLGLSSQHYKIFLQHSFAPAYSLRFRTRPIRSLSCSSTACSVLILSSVCHCSAGLRHVILWISHTRSNTWACSVESRFSGSSAACMSSDSPHERRLSLDRKAPRRRC